MQKSLCRFGGGVYDTEIRIFLLKKCDYLLYLVSDDQTFLGAEQRYSSLHFREAPPLPRGKGGGFPKNDPGRGGFPNWGSPPPSLIRLKQKQ